LEEASMPQQMTGRERVLALLEGRAVDRLPLMPITMMFAARRSGLPYGRYALDCRVLAEAQVRTAVDFGFDHVSTITETREAPDCGAVVRLFEDQPYALDEANARLADKSILAEMTVPDPFRAVHMSDRLSAIALLRERTKGGSIVEGWVEGPCGAAADLRGINRLMLDFYDDAPFVRDLFEFVLEVGLRFGRAQAAAGADLVGVGDPAASLVGPRIYDQFVWPYEKRLVDGLHAAGLRVRLHICGDTRRILKSMGALGCDIVDIDSVVPVEDARSQMGPEQVLLGGIDPVRVLQDGSEDLVLSEAARCRQAAGDRYILGAGCEIPPGTPERNVAALQRYVVQEKRPRAET
jgi:MtaA/CmuA family methyltransferase